MPLCLGIFLISTLIPTSESWAAGFVQQFDESGSNEPQLPIQVTVGIMEIVS